MLKLEELFIKIDPTLLPWKMESNRLGQLSSCDVMATRKTFLKEEKYVGSRMLKRSIFLTFL